MDRDESRQQTKTFELCIIEQPSRLVSLIQKYTELRAIFAKQSEDGP